MSVADMISVPMAPADIGAKLAVETGKVVTGNDGLVAMLRELKITSVSGGNTETVSETGDVYSADAGKFVSFCATASHYSILHAAPLNDAAVLRIAAVNIATGEYVASVNDAAVALSVGNWIGAVWDTTGAGTSAYVAIFWDEDA